MVGLGSYLLARLKRRYIDLKVSVVSLCQTAWRLLQVGWPMPHPSVTAAASMVQLIWQMVKTQVDCRVQNSAPTEYNSFRWISLTSVRHSGNTADQSQ
ncbi:hypothetical protein PoB_006156800 [Plakobranchus ocellatus]|uniref:Uncharacterized protein n=1 Tax=Plakobranchus ocellatus TaxID=259542 RepID=A0AAV4CT91_9GAST|nr:hypothetical protein PoB_006156800 [Plakobranchus ocellatus]